jgi:hypothetical protein
MSRIGLTDRQWAFIRLFGAYRSWFTVAVLLVCIRRLVRLPSRWSAQRVGVCCPVRRSHRHLVTFSGEYSEVVFRAARGLCSGSTAPVTYLRGTWECSADGTTGGYSGPKNLDNEAARNKIDY